MVLFHISVRCRMPGFSRLTVQEQEHAPRVLQQLNSLRREGILCDCVLQVEDKEFPVHRAFLAACSPYFRALFTSQMKESGRSLVVIGGVSVETFELLLDFIYTGEVKLSEENIIRRGFPGCTTVSATSSPGHLLRLLC